MVCNTQNDWVFGLCPSSGILKIRKQRFGNWICFRPQVRWATPALLDPLERANLNYGTILIRKHLFRNYSSPFVFLLSIRFLVQVSLLELKTHYKSICNYIRFCESCIQYRHTDVLDIPIFRK
jgi:hypothetical protein